MVNKKRKYSVESPVKASLYYTICSIVQKGFNVLLIPLYVRLMTTDQYGEFTLFQSWSGIVLVFTTLNLASYAFNNSLIKNEDKKDYVTSSFLGLICALTTFVSLTFILFIGFWEKIFGLGGEYVVSLALDSFFVVAIDLWYARNKFEYKYKGVVAVTILSAALNMLTGIALVYLSKDKAFAAVLAKLIVQGIITAVISVSVFVKGKSFFSADLWKYALSFNIPLIPHFLSLRILQQADRIMIERFCGLTDAGVYGFSYKIAECMMIFNSALLSSMIPWTYKNLKNKNYSGIFGMVFNTICIIGVVNLLLIILAPEAVSILGTNEYKEAVYIIPPIACSCYLMYLFNVFANITYFYEQNKLVTFASIIAAALNIILNYIFIPVFGYFAAGYTTLISYICLAIMHAFMYRYTLKIKGINQGIYNLNYIVLFSLFVVVMGCSFTLLYMFDLWYIRYGLMLIILAAAFVKRGEIVNKFRDLKER